MNARAVNVLCYRVETPTELRFMTPEVQPSRTGVSLANSPLQLGTELSRSESRTLQVLFVPSLQLHFR